MEGAGKTDLFGDLFDEGARRLEAFGGGIHFQAQKKAVGALVAVAPKQTAQVGAVDVAFGGDLRQGAQAQEMAVNVLAAVLIGGEGQCAGASKRGARVLDFEGQTFEQFGGKSGGVAATSQAAGDQFFKDPLQLRWRKNLSDRSRRQLAGAQHPPGLSPRKIDEVFQQRVIRVGGDLMRHAGAVREDRAGIEGMLAAAQFEFALSPGDVFDGEEGKGEAVDRVISADPLDAAADDHKSLGGRRIEVEVKAAGFHNPR